MRQLPLRLSLRLLLVLAIVCSLYTYVGAQCTAGPNERIISGRVYQDNNLNQVDDTEPAISNVDVLIYEDVNQNGVIDGLDILLTTIPSDASGDFTYTSTPVRRTYADDFEGDVFSGFNNNTGSADWLNDAWVRSGNNASTNDVSAFVVSFDNDWDFTSQTVQIQNSDAGLYRLVDLSDATTATLNFQYDWDDSNGSNLDGGELLFIQIDPENDGTYIQLDTIEFFEAEIPVTNRSISIPSVHLGGAQSRIRFITEDSTRMSFGEAWWIDNVELEVVDQVTHYLITTDIGTYPPSISLSTDNIETTTLLTGGTCDSGNDFGLRICGTGCPPIAEDDAVLILQGESVQIFVLDNDLDVDGNLDPGSLSLQALPSDGNVTLDVGSNSFIYTPVGSFIGTDQFTYEICDSGSPSLCDLATVTIQVVQQSLDVCDVANTDHTFYLPFPADNLFTAFRNSAPACSGHGNSLISIVSIKCPYPGAIINYDHWEDGYESDEFSPVQATSVVWGDGNLGNGIAPGYPDDIIPAGGNIIIEETFSYNPRDPNDIFFDGKDRLSTSSNIALSYIAGDVNHFNFQTAKTDVYDLDRFGTSFTVPFGENIASDVFQYTGLFMRASQDSTVVNIDTDSDMTTDTSQTLNQGEVFFIDGGIIEGAIITSNRPIGVDVFFANSSCFGTRQVNLFPATFYSDLYYTPVPTTDAIGPVTIYFYNSLNRDLDINWTSNVSSGTITVTANSAQDFLLPQINSAFRFQSATGDSYTAVSIVDDDAGHDWSFNLISANQLSNFASIAWAPGSRNNLQQYNPVWVTPVANTTLYVKYDGNLTDTASLLSPCRIPYDTAYVLNELDFIRLYDDSDNDQSGLAVFTCDGTAVAAVYGEDPSVAPGGGSETSDVGTTIQPMCIDPAILANNDRDSTIADFPVTTDVLENDRAFLTDLDSTSVTIVNNPTNGTTSVNSDGTITYMPNPGYFGTDQYQYFVCSLSDPDLCDFATVTISITACPADLDQKLISGSVYIDQNQNGINDVEPGLGGVSVNVYEDVDMDGTVTPGDVLLTTQVTDPLGSYFAFINGSQIVVAQENFSSGDYSGGSGWTGIWTETSENNTDPPLTDEIQVISEELRIVDDDPTLTRTIDLTSYTGVAMSFDFKRIALELGENLDVQVDDGSGFTTIFTVFANNGTDLNFLNTGDIDLSAYDGQVIDLRLNPNSGWFNSTTNDVIFVDNIVVTAEILASDFVIEPVVATIPVGYAGTTPTTQALTVVLGGVCSRVDFGYINPCEVGLDSDLDGLADICDIDDDNDGIPDVIENSVCDDVAVLGYDALYNYDNSLDDESANNYDAQNVPGESYSSDAIVGDAAIDFDGSYFVRYSDNTFLNQAITNFSYSFWFNPSSLSGIQFLIEEGGGTNGLAIRLEGNRLQARIKEGGNTWNSEEFIISNTGLWNHVALTYVNGDLTFYLNNIAKPTLLTTIGQLASHGDHSGFGGNNGGNVYSTGGLAGFNGLMDQIIHYPFALDSTEVAHLYHVCDTDGDGVFNRFDLDSDNDGLLDVYEAGHGLSADSDGVISDADNLIGSNGLVDGLETFPDSGILNYNLSDSEDTPDGIYDPYELDSDDDGCFDAAEESVSDPDMDGIAGNGAAIVDLVGLVNSVKPYAVPPNDEWQDPLLFSGCVEVCFDGIDNDGDGLIDCEDCEDCYGALSCPDNDQDGVSDFCDIDDDNDGILDSLECPMLSYGPELVVNGDFENGYANWTSFFNRGRNNNGPTSDGCSIQGWVALSPCASSNGICDEYYEYNGSQPTGSIVITDPLGSGANVITTTICDQTNGTCLAEILPDHTTGTGLSLYVDPSDVPGRAYWQQEISVLSNTIYEFSAWIMVIEEDPNLQFRIDGQDLTVGFNLDRLTPGTDGPDLWQRVFAVWNSGAISGLVTIELVNLTAGCGGNDMRLDDVSLREVITPCDCDGDLVFNYLDLDSDNDGILDVYEAGHGSAADGTNRIDDVVANVGVNGFDDRLETAPDNGIPGFSLANSELTPDGEYDACELDSDGDGCFDSLEESVFDPDNDGIAGAGVPSVDINGLVDTIMPYVVPPNDVWQDVTMTSGDCGCKIATMNPHVLYYKN